MYACYTRVHVHSYVHTLACAHMYRYVHMPAFMYIAYMYTSVYAMRACKYMHVRVRACAYVCVCKPNRYCMFDSCALCYCAELAMLRV